MVVFGVTLIVRSAPILAQEDAPGQYAGRDAKWWIAKLADDEEFRGAQAALLKIGGPAQIPLAMALREKDRSTRDRALFTLRQMRLDPTPVFDLVLLAMDPRDARFTRSLLGWFQSLGRSALPCLSYIAPSLECGDRETVRIVLACLVGLAPESRKELPRVFAVARTGEPRLRVAAVDAAARIAPDDPEVVAILAEVMKTADDDGRRDLLIAAGHLHPEVPGLAEVVVWCSKDPAAAVGVQAAGLLAEIVLVDRSRLDALLALLDDSEVGVRSAAASAASKLGTIATPAVARLTALLVNDAPEDDLNAMTALTAIGTAASSAWPAMMNLLDRFEPPYRMFKRAFLDTLALDPGLAIQALSSDREPPRRLALEAIYAWTWPEWRARFDQVREPLARALRLATDPVSYEIQILVKFQQMRYEGSRLHDFYLSLADAASPRVRQMAGQLFSTHAEAVPALLCLLAGEDARKRDFAWQVFLQDTSGGRLKEVQNGLLPLLHGDNPAAADLAARLLVRHYFIHETAGLTEQDGTALAERFAGMFDDPEDRRMAVIRMGAMGAFALPYVEKLLTRLEEEETWLLKSEAAASLRRIAASGDAAAEMVTPLLQAVLTGDDAVTAAAVARAVARDEPFQAVILKLLPGLLGDPRPKVRINAIMAAGVLGERAESLVPILLALAGEPSGDLQVRGVAITALAGIVPGDERVLCLCVQALLREPHGGGHTFILMNGGEPAARLLADALPSASTKKKVEILAILSQLGSAAYGVVDRIRPLLEHPDKEVARVAEMALRNIRASRE